MRFLCGLLAFVLAGCGMTDDRTILEDIAPASAATTKIEALFKTARVPGGFAPIKAFAGHTTWGATYSSYSAGYSASAAGARAFLDAAHARRDTIAYRSAEGCPPAPAGSELAAPSAFLKLWMDSGVLDRCATIERWQVPASELMSDRAVASVFRVVQSVHADDERPTVVVIGVSFPSSYQR